MNNIRQVKGIAIKQGSWISDEALPLPYRYAPELLETCKEIYTQLGEDMIDNNLPDNIYNTYQMFHNRLGELIAKTEGRDEK